MDNNLSKPDVGEGQHLLTPSKLIFGAETYVGNWYEETVRNTLAREEFLKKRECEELSIQKSQIMVDFLLKPVRLTARRDGYLYYGDSVQIISPGPDCQSAIEVYPFKKYCKFGQLGLSSSIPPLLIDYRPFLDTDSIISVSPHLFPVVRNSFVIERPDCPKDNYTIVHYGDTFRIRAMPTQYFPLYIHSAPASALHTAAIHSGKPQVRFSDTTNPNTLWRAIPLDPLTKFKMDFGIPIPLKTRMLIQHALSGNNLSLEPDYPILTYFGDEFEVTVHNKLDRVKRFAWSNHWSFDTERGWRKPDKDISDQAKFSAAINADVVTKSASQDSKDAAAAEVQQDIDKYDEPLEQPQDIQKPMMTIEQFEKNQLSKNLEKMRIDTGVPGHVMPYDYRTSPQPHAHDYHLNENEILFPNQKYNCSGTQCCYPVQPQQLQKQDCKPPETDCYDHETYSTMDTRKHYWG